MMLATKSCCKVCGEEVSVEGPFRVDAEGYVICANHPWAEGEQKAAAPADKEQENG